MSVREVGQTTFYDGAGTRGNCVAAAVASVFGLPLDVVEHQGLKPGVGFQSVADWTRERCPALEYREQDFCTNFRCVEIEGEGDRWEYDLPDPQEIPAPPTCGYWIAHVISPRGLLADGPYRGMPIQHAVVMRGGELVWDPHPQRDMGVGARVGMGWWVARDPATLIAWRFCAGLMGDPTPELIDEMARAA